MPPDDWGPIYDDAGAQYGVDPNLLRSLVSTESHGDTTAVSSAGATGPAQIMPDTAAALGVTDPTDPAQAIPAAARLLRENFDRYQDPQLAIAAYHGGTDTANWGPKTMAYVQKVQDAYHGYQSGDDGQQPDQAPAPAVSSVTNKVDAARKAGYSDQEIADYLHKSPSFAPKFDAARKAGYSDSEIYQHFGLNIGAPAATGITAGDLAGDLAGGSTTPAAIAPAAPASTPVAPPTSVQPVPNSANPPPDAGAAGAMVGAAGAADATLDPNAVEGGLGPWLTRAGKGIAREVMQTPGAVLKGTATMAEPDTYANERMGMVAPDPADAMEALAHPGPSLTTSPLYKTGLKLQQEGAASVPMTPEEQASVAGQVGTGLGGLGTAVASSVIGPAGPIYTFGLQGAGDELEKAHAAGATPQQEQAAAQQSFGMNAAAGVLDVEAALRPIARSAPGLMDWAATRLQQAIRSGVVFTGIGEAQQWLGAQIDENFNPKAHYDFDPKRLVSELLTGATAGAVRPAHAQETPEAPAQPEQAAAPPPGPGDGDGIIIDNPPQPPPSGPRPLMTGPRPGSEPIDVTPTPGEPLTAGPRPGTEPKSSQDIIDYAKQNLPGLMLEASPDEGPQPPISERGPKGVVANAEVPADLTQGNAAAKKQDGIINAPGQIPDGLDIGSGSTGSSGFDTAQLQSGANVLVPNADLARNLVEAQTKPSESYGVTDPAYLGMLHAVLSSTENPQVFRSIVQAIPVDVMNDLAGSKRAAKDLSGDSAMFVNALSAKANLPVGRDAVLAAVRGAATPIAKHLGIDNDLTRRPDGSLAAVGANNLDTQGTSPQTHAQENNNEPISARKQSNVGPTGPAEGAVQGAPDAGAAQDAGGSPTAVAEPSAQPGADNAQQAPVTAPPAAPRRPPDLIEFLAQQGGLKDFRGELKHLDAHKRFVPGQGMLVRKGGKGISMDYAREAALEAGYPVGDTVGSFLDALETNLRGTHVFKQRDTGQAADWQMHRDQAKFGTPGEDNRDDDELYRHAHNLGIDLSGDETPAEVLNIVQEREAMMADPDAFEPLADHIENDMDARFGRDLPAVIDEIPWGDEDSHATAKAHQEQATARGPPQAGGEPVGAEGAAGDREGLRDDAGTGREPAVSRTPTHEQTEQGSQFVVPGAERSARQAAQSREDEGHGRIKPKAAQKDADEGLFGSPAPADLFAPREEPAAEAVPAKTGPQMAFAETTHTKSGTPLFVAKLDGERLPPEEYKALLAEAKKLGGYYSSLKTDSAIPGFQFRDKAAAKQLIEEYNNGGEPARARMALAEMRRGPGGDAQLRAAITSGNVKRGAQAVIDRMRLQAGLDDAFNRRPGSPGRASVDRSEIREVEDFIDFIGHHMFSDVGLRILKGTEGGALGSYRTYDHIVSIFRQAINHGELARTAVHELWHSLERVLPRADYAAVTHEFQRQQQKWLTKNKWAQPFLRNGELRDSIQGREGREWLDGHENDPTAMDAVSVFSDDKGVPRKVAIRWTPENYRFKNREEYFAETMADKSFKDADIQNAKARSVFAHVRDIFRRMGNGIARLFGRDQTGRIFEGFRNQEYQAGENPDNPYILGGTWEARRGEKAPSDSADISRETEAGPNDDGLLEGTARSVQPRVHEGVAENPSTRPRATSEERLPSLRERVQAPGETGSEAVPDLRQPEEPDASRGLQQAAGRDVAMSEMPPDAASRDRNLAKFLKGSKAPAVLYHGVNVHPEPRGGISRPLGDIDRFDRHAAFKAFNRPEGMDAVGTWLSESPSPYGKDEPVHGAGMYAGAENGAIYPVHASLKNPWKPKSFDEFLDKMHQTAGRDPKKQNPRGRGSVGELRDWLESKGYDSIYFPAGEIDSDKAAPVWVALHPEQIKSATGNRGTFDRTNPDIAAQAVGATEPHAGETEIYPGVFATRSEAFDEKAGALQAAAKGILARIAPGTQVGGFERLRMGTTELHGAYMNEPDGLAHAVAWSLAAPDVAGTVRHEAIHYLRRAGLFTPDEWKTLADTAERDGWLDKHQVNDRLGWDHLAEDQKVEEAVAEEFAGWKRDGGWLGKLPAPIRAIFNKISAFHRQLADAARHILGREATPDDVFSRVERGEVGRRTPVEAIEPSTEVAAQPATESEAEPTEEAQTKSLTDKLAAPIKKLLSTEPAQKVLNGSTMNGARDALREFGRDVMMKTDPLGLGSDAAKATAKDYANEERRISYHLSQIDKMIMSKYDPDERANMGRALDEQSVMDQQMQVPAIERIQNERDALRNDPDIDAKDRAVALAKLTREYNRVRKETAPLTSDRGLGRLPEDQRALAETLNSMSQRAWKGMQDAGIVDGAALPHYMPRYFVNVIDDKGTVAPAARGDTASRLDPIGTNLRTNGPGRRSYLTPEESEAAARTALGRNANLVQDIRALLVSLQRSQRAIAGKELIKAVKEIGEKSGAETVSDEPKDGFFTIDHPAFTEIKPSYREDEDGNMVPRLDENGKPILTKKPIYVSREFEGPLRAVLNKPTGALYNALMQVKATSVGLIMMSPMTHNMVIYGKAFPLMPGKMLTLGLYRDGYQVRKDPQLMDKFIGAGMVPINGGWMQDILGVAREAGAPPGRSLIARGLGNAVGLVGGEKANMKTRSMIDAAGHFWHGTLLWDRIADLQAGIAQNMRNQLIAKGVDDDTATTVAAHFANRFAGAMPKEALSDIARKVANLTLFSRSFTLGNLGIMKDVMTGLPSEVKAQLNRNQGKIVADAAKSIARRKAIGTFIADLALFYGMNAAVQLGIQGLRQYLNDKDEHPLDELGKIGSDVAHGFARRWSELVDRRTEHPLDWLNPFDDISSLSPLHDNEPGKQDRIFVGTDHTGRGVYVKNPFGKVGEEFKNYLTSPLSQIKAKLSPFIRPVLDTVANADNFGRKVYNADDGSVTSDLKAIGDIIAHWMTAQVPMTTIQGGYDYASGAPDADMSIAKSAVPFFTGLSVSQGSRLGPQGAIEKQVYDRHEQAILALYPQIADLVSRGNVEDAQKKLAELGETPGQIVSTIAKLQHPEIKTGPSGYLGKDFNKYATPVDRNAYENVTR